MMNIVKGKSAAISIHVNLDQTIDFYRLYTNDLYNYGYLCIVCFSLSCIVKHFEILKALYKFPIIIKT